MPTLPFFELRATGVDRHRQVADASDITKYRRIAATYAPFKDQLPKLGWKSPSLNTEMQLIKPVFGLFRSQFPNTN
jgi:hypothetical protein